MKKTILLLGGTGAMGNHLVGILSDGGHDVYVTSRNFRRGKDGVTYVKGNAHDMDFLNSLLTLKKWDVIVDFMIYSTSEFTQKAELLLQSCGQYVFLSSSRVYADSKVPITEKSPRLLDVCKDKEYLLTDEYALSKAREENVLLGSKRKNWTIIRPYITYSEIRLQLGVLEKEYWLYQALHDRTVVFSKDIASKTTTLTYGYDVARGIASLLGQESALGEAFHITVTEHHTWQGIFDVYLRVLEEEIGKKPNVLMLDENPRMAIMGHNWQVKYDRYFNRVFDNSKIAQYIDVNTFKPTLQGVEQCLRDFIKHPSYRIQGYGEFAMYDRITGAWMPFSEIHPLKNKLKYILRRTLFHL